MLRDKFLKIGKRLDDARELRKYTKGRFKITITEDYFRTLLPHQDDVRILANWLTHDAKLLAQDDEMDNALRSCESSLALGCAYRDDPFAVSFLAQWGMTNFTVNTIERVLAQGEASDSALQQLQTRALAESRLLNSTTAMRGERAGHHQFFEGVRSGRLSLNGLIRGGNNGDLLAMISEWGENAMPSIYLRQYPDQLRFNTALVELAKLPLHERKEKFLSHQKSLEATNNLLRHAFAATGTSANNAEGRTRGLLLAAAAGIACERYRLQHPDRAWPKSLEDVVKKGLLDELPRDPIDDQPLRYRIAKEGLVVYSIGTDEKDDAGNIDIARWNQPGVDIGVRLWNVNLRRQRPLPAPAEPEVRN